MIALRKIHTQLADELECLFVFDELGDGLLAESSGQVDHGAHEDLVGGAIGQGPDELPVDLEVLTREVLEVVERPEAHPEVVQRQPTPVRPDPFGERVGVREVLPSPVTHAALEAAVAALVERLSATPRDARCRIVGLVVRPANRPVASSGSAAARSAVSR